MPPNPPRIIPTERLASLCEESRAQHRPQQAGKGLLAFEIGEIEPYPRATSLAGFRSSKACTKNATFLWPQKPTSNTTRPDLSPIGTKLGARALASLFPAFRPPEPTDHIHAASPQVEDKLQPPTSLCAKYSEAPARAGAQKVKAAMDITLTTTKPTRRTQASTRVFAKNQPESATQFAAELPQAAQPPRFG